MDWRSAPDSTWRPTIDQSRGNDVGANTTTTWPTAHAIATEVVLLLRQHTHLTGGRIEWANGSNYPAKAISNRVIKYAM
jgi:hypothetical protein